MSELQTFGGMGVDETDLGSNAQLDLEAIDAQAREKALDIVSSCIVQAPAGSGKTELLIQRFLALLATVDAPEEIVSITFTRKASAEMRVRIMRALADAESDVPAEPHAQKTRMLALAVLKRDDQLHWSLRDQPSRLRIMTIDALNGWIVRQMPWISGMGTQPAISDDTGELYREAIAEVLLSELIDENTRRNVTKLLLHLDNRYGLIEELLAQMLGIREQWSVLLSERQEFQESARQIIEASLHSIVSGHTEQLCAIVAQNELQEMVDLARHAATRLSAGENASTDALAIYIESDRLPGNAAEDLPLWLGIAQLLLTKQGTLRSARGVNKKIGFETKDPEKQRMQDLLDRVSGSTRFVSALADLSSLPAVRFSEAQWDVLSSILQVLSVCLDKLRVLFARRGAVDHVEVAGAALRALGGDLTPTDLAMMLEYRVQHILIDEFQDTSAGQFRLLRLLTAGWMSEDGHTLFLVGDPMQSIYRFREAEVGLFLRVWKDRRIGSVPLLSLRLHRNFRSQEGIVTWVNNVFPSVFPTANDAASGAVAYVHAKATRAAAEGAVNFIPVFSRDRSVEAMHVVEILRDLGHGAADSAAPETGSTAVLVRSRAHLAEIIPQLRSAGIPFKAVEIEALASHPAVQDVLSLTRALTHTGDRTAWLSVLRAPFVGLRLEDLHALCGDNTSDEIPALMAEEDRLRHCTEDGSQRITRAVLPLRAALSDIGRKPLRRLVEGCWIALGGPACVDALGFDAVQSFLMLLGESERGGGLDNLGDLLSNVQKLYAPPDPGGENPVQIMTIHKSKGLQFDNVILPRLDGTPPHRSERLFLWLENAGPSQEDFLIAPLKERGADDDPTYRYLQKIISGKERNEYHRLLYVAVTRARQRLFLTASLRVAVGSDGVESLRPPRANSFLHALWPFLETETAERYAERKAVDERTEDAPSDAMSMRALTRLHAEWQFPAFPAKLEIAAEAELDEAGESTRKVLPPRAGLEARLAGIAVHRLLAALGRKGTQWWLKLDQEGRTQVARRLLWQLGHTVAQHEIVQRTVRAIDNTVRDEKGRWLLSAHAEARSEWAVTGNVNGRNETVIIDRTFLDDEGIRWIIDFKSAEHEGGDLDGFLAAQEALHAEQLHRYSRIVGALENRPQRLALYFPLLLAWREVPVPGQGALPPSS